MRRWYLFALPPLLAIGPFACSRSPDPAPSRAATTESAVVPRATGSAPPAPSSNAEGPRITGVRAHGSGCPSEASARTTIAPDGQSAIADLATFDADLTSGGVLQVKEC